MDGRRKDAAAAGAVLRWAFEHQAELRALAATRRARRCAREIEREFPAVKGCLGGTLVRSKLTKSLRWAVANAIPVLTPQLFVAGSRLCDEDTDLGLEYTLSRMLSPEAEAERSRRAPSRRPGRLRAPRSSRPWRSAPAAPAAAPPPDPARSRPAPAPAAAQRAEAEPAAPPAPAPPLEETAPRRRRPAHPQPPAAPSDEETRR